MGATDESHVTNCSRVLFRLKKTSHQTPIAAGIPNIAPITTRTLNQSDAVKFEFGTAGMGMKNMNKPVTTQLTTVNPPKMIIEIRDHGLNFRMPRAVANPHPPSAK